MVSRCARGQTGNKTYREGPRVQEGDLGRVEVDVAIGLGLVEGRSHEVWQVDWYLDRRHVTSRRGQVAAAQRTIVDVVAIAVTLKFLACEVGLGGHSSFP